jgi:hypothetical protein
LDSKFGLLYLSSHQAVDQTIFDPRWQVFLRATQVLYGAFIVLLEQYLSHSLMRWGETFSVDRRSPFLLELL